MKTRLNREDNLNLHPNMIGPWSHKKTYQNEELLQFDRDKEDLREEIYHLKKLRLKDQTEISRLKHMITRYNLDKTDAYKNEDNQ
mmetsp:Transcript_42949/g.93401  ORF Transcript_42949/g.93401 Transcript_42949/m.93401 type:complete len:85 (-) Transcript_42949:645-899(-)